MNLIMGLLSLTAVVVFLLWAHAGCDFGLSYVGQAIAVRRSGAWCQTRGKTYLMKKLKPIGEKRVVPSDSCFAENLFVKLFRLAAPSICGNAPRFLKPEFAKEHDQLIRMFRYALAVIDKYPLAPNARAVLLRQCLCAFSEYIPYDTKINLETSAITFNGFAITGFQKDDHRELHICFTDTLTSDDSRRKYNIECLGALEIPTAYAKVSRILLREYQYVPHFCNPEAF